MMKRREFNRVVGTSVVGGLAGLQAAVAAPASGARRNTLMHVGGDYHSVAGTRFTAKENLEYNLRHGVRHLTAQIPRKEGGWDLDELKRMKDDCDKAGVTLEAIRMDANYITLRKGPERDRELDTILGNIRKASEVGVKIVTYHWTVIPIRRNAHARPRRRNTCLLQAGRQLEGSAGGEIGPGFRG